MGKQDRADAPVPAANGAAAAHREVEIKLSGPSDVLEGLFVSPVLASLGQGRVTAKQIENIYYDTPDLDLRQQGMALRVRKDGQRFEQTLKAMDDGASVMAGRDEWSTALSSAEPEFAAFAEQVGPAVPGKGKAPDLRRLFTTRYRRKVRRVATGGDQPAVIEAALDLGRIETEAGCEPIAELELELVEGQPEQLYGLALDLARLAPLRLEHRSKSARGYALVTGAKPIWHKALDLDLDPKASVRDAMAAIFRACHQQWLANEAAAQEGSDPEGVHQLRVALRRLRSALTVFGKVLPADQLEWLKRDAKWLIAQTGRARDWDVFLTETLPPLAQVLPDDAGVARLGHEVEEQRRLGYQQLRSALDGGEYAQCLLRFGRWLEAEAWQAGDAKILRMPIVKFADQLLAKRHKRALQLGRNFAQLSPPERHELRIALKKLRYTAEFFTALHKPKRTRRYLKHLKTLQDDLGHLNDVAVAEQLLGTALQQAAPAEQPTMQHAAGLIQGWHLRRVQDLAPRVAASWADFAATKPFWR